MVTWLEPSLRRAHILTHLLAVDQAETVKRCSSYWPVTFLNQHWGSILWAANNAGYSTLILAEEFLFLFHCCQGSLWARGKEIDSQHVSQRDISHINIVICCNWVKEENVQEYSSNTSINRNNTDLGKDLLKFDLSDLIWCFLSLNCLLSPVLLLLLLLNLHNKANQDRKVFHIYIYIWNCLFL